MISGGLTNFLSWSIRKIGTATLFTWLLIILLFSTLLIGLEDIVRGLDLTSVVVVSCAGFFMGWLFARSRLSGWTALLLIFIYGVIVVAAIPGGLGNPLYSLWRQSIQVFWNTLATLLDLEVPYENILAITVGELRVHLVFLIDQFPTWLAALVQGKPSFNPFMTTLAWSTALWFCAAWAGWSIRRLSKPLAGIVPVAILFITSLSYVRAGTGLLLPFLGSTVFLVAWVAYQSKLKYWQRSQTDYPDDIGYEIIFTGIILTFGLVGIAWLVSIVPTHKILSYVQQLTQPHAIQESPVGESLGLQQRSGNQGGLGLAGSLGGLPRSHLLGSGPELSQQLVMFIHIDDPTTEDILSDPHLDAARYYWRSLTYDVYTGSGWVTSPIEIKPYRSGRQAVAPEFGYHIPAVQNIRVVEDLGGVLHQAGELITTDHNFEVYWRTSPQDVFDSFGSKIIDLDPQTDWTYSATSYRTIASEELLRSAGDNYPQWVRERYLQIPEELPDRVLALSQELTESAPTPYDKALAIADYLRKYPYTLDLPEPPQDQDIVDYFLFEQQQGYCDYYATSMVILARAAGLPARLASGYASGTYDEINDRYIVSQENAHSWVEIYFPEIGWIEFEPTAALPIIDRPEQLTFPEILTIEPEKSIFSLNQITSRFNWLSWVGLFLVGLVLAIMAWYLGDRWILKRSSPSQTAVKLYKRLYRNGLRLNIQTYPGNTPNEFANNFGVQINERSHSSWWSKLFTPAHAEIRTVSDIYSQSIYSPNPPGKKIQGKIIRVWGKLRWRLLAARLLGKKAGRQNL